MPIIKDVGSYAIILLIYSKMQVKRQIKVNAHLHTLSPRFILINLAKLASASDDSAGGITDARGYVRDVLEKACSCVKHGSTEAEYIYLQSIKDSRNKAFDGWDEFAYDLLLKTARLATEDNEQEMFSAADELYSKASDRAYSSWADAFDVLVRLEVVKATGSDIDVANYIAANLKYDAVRRIAVASSINASDYAHAEKLCFDALAVNEETNKYSRPSEWWYMLFEIYDKSGETEKKIQAAEDLLFRFNTKYYAVLKQLLTPKGVWRSEYPSILVRLEQSFSYHKLMEILSKEGEFSLLLEQDSKYPSCVFDYGKQLSERFSQQTYSLCIAIIHSEANEANNRIKYTDTAWHKSQKYLRRKRY